MTIRVFIDPIHLIKSSIVAQDIDLHNKFIILIKNIYQYQIFKGLMDLVVTKIHQKSLKFIVQDQGTFDLDEGNCKTITGGIANSLFNTFRTNKHYIITIKKLTYDVIIHEIAHMIDQETAMDMAEFRSIITPEIQNKSSALVIEQTVKNVMVEQLKSYPSEKHVSELFARYFQILAMSKEVSGLSQSYGYSLQNAIELFPNTTAWVFNKLYFKMNAFINQDIANFSQSYIKPLDDIKHKWSEEKVQPFKKSGGWSSSVKSIKS